jgi:Mrp family chromosome partitioning ATPase/predicted Fe-Mo cluster-binding NifX family protein
MMENISHKFLVLSGKGGVGKSSIAVNLALWLSMRGNKVGLLDIDIHGPSIPKLLNLENKSVHAEGEIINPLTYSDTLKVMSIGLLLHNESEALIWRGPMKHNMIGQFVKNVCWGELDYLIVDCPPGTGDEPLSIVQLLGNIDGAVIVTTPQDIAVIDVKKCITFCRQLHLPILGIIENMSGFVCPHCNNNTEIFKGDGGRKMALDFNVPFLGKIPIDPALALAGDSGEPFISLTDNTTAKALSSAFETLFKLNEQVQTNIPQNDTLRNETQINKEKRNNMRIAIPITDGKLSSHFGHCEQFAIIDADRDSKSVKHQEMVTPPQHEPGLLPKWLAGMNVELVIAGGMGQRAQQLFAQNNIEVAIGAPENEPQELVLQYLSDQLQCGQNICDH